MTRTDSALKLVIALAWLAASAACGAQTTGDEPDAAEYSRRGADTCLGCHDDAVVAAVFRTAHGVPTDPRSPFGAGQLQCEACHGPGGEHAGRVRRGQERPPVIRFGRGTETTIAGQNEMCLGCHDTMAGFGWHGTAHDDNDVGCAECHDIHNPHDPVRVTASQPDVCFGCHQQQRIEALKPYSHPFEDGKMDCGGCHDPHSPLADTLFARQTLNDTCFDCHAEKRGPFLWEHAPVAEDCSNCHNPHGTSHPGMVNLRGPMLCQGCHAQAGHPGLARGPEGLADDTPSQFLLGRNCLNCHTQIHGSNHPSGSKLMR